MKRKYSPSWESSVQPRKQRKHRANAPLHTKHKFLSANLSKTLRAKHGKRNVPLRKGDEVLVMRGAFKKKKAKIDSVDLKRIRVTLENIQRKKKDGTKISVYFAPSSLQIQALNLEDNKRIASIDKGKKKDRPGTAGLKKKDRRSDADLKKVNKKEREVKSTKTTGEKNASDKSTGK